MALTTPLSDEVVPPLAQVNLLGRGTGPMGFRCGRLACGNTFSPAVGCLLCKDRLRLLPLYTATVVLFVVSPQSQH